MKKLIALLLLSTFTAGSVVTAFAAPNSVVVSMDKDKDKDKKKDKKGSCCSKEESKSCGSSGSAAQSHGGDGKAAPAKSGGCCSKDASKSCTKPAEKK
jgi:hypothetical protein